MLVLLHETAAQVISISDASNLEWNEGLFSLHLQMLTGESYSQTAIAS